VRAGCERVWPSTGPIFEGWGARPEKFPNRSRFRHHGADSASLAEAPRELLQLLEITGSVAHRGKQADCFDGGNAGTWSDHRHPWCDTCYEGRTHAKLRSLTAIDIFIPTRFLRGPRLGAELPSPNTKRWVVRRKAAVVAAVRAGVITLEEAYRRYQLSGEEFLAWQRAFDADGLPSLRSTRVQ
jgi:hypothetical protein